MSDLSAISSRQITKADHERYFVTEPDGFSPERNKAIVEKTIQEYEVIRAKKLKEKVENYEERADAVVTYLKSLDQGKTNQSVEKYFGRKMLAQLRGQEIRDKLMSGLTIKNKEGAIMKAGL